MQTQNVAQTKFEEWKNMHEFFTNTESDKQNNSRSPANPPDVTEPNWAASERAFFKGKNLARMGDGQNKSERRIQRRLLLRRSQASAIFGAPCKSKWRPAA